jgi:hypothetical protein
MTRIATAAAVGAVGLVAAAGVVFVTGDADFDRSAASVTRTTSTPDPATESSSGTPAPPTTTGVPVEQGPLTTADAAAALPTVGGEFGPADLEVELASVCDGATFDLFSATPVYASLQSTEVPLAYLDAVIIVYATAPGASTAYDGIAEAIGRCALTRTATPTPTATDDVPIPIEIEGEVRPGVVVDGRPAVQWVQIQSADGTELRTAITVVRVENTLVAVSVDQDAGAIDADDLANVSIRHAVAIAAALRSATETE